MELQSFNVPTPVWGHCGVRDHGINEPSPSLLGKAESSFNVTKAASSNADIQVKWYLPLKVPQSSMEVKHV